MLNNPSMRRLSANTLGSEIAFVRANIELMKLQVAVTTALPSLVKTDAAAGAIAALSAYASQGYEALYIPGYPDVAVMSLLELAHSLYDTELAAEEALAASRNKAGPGQSPCPELDALLATIKRFEAAAKAAPPAQ